MKAILYVDETGSFQGTAGQFYIGATGVFVPRKSAKEFERCCASFRAALSVFGASPSTEIHAVEWVQNPTGFPENTHVHVRVHWLRRFMTTCAECSGIVVINVIADSKRPRSNLGGNTPTPAQLATQMRRDVFEKLFREFELTLQEQNIKGHAWVDENQIGSVRALHRSMRHQLPLQPLAPIGVESHEHLAVQLADVCAYFMLQQATPNNSLRPRDASHGLNDVAKLCPDPVNAGYALVHFV